MIENRLSRSRVAAQVAGLFCLFYLVSAVGQSSIEDPYKDRYSKNDPFGETEKVGNLAKLGWDLKKEWPIAFWIHFSDDKKYREPNAKAFAAKLNKLGYSANAQRCPNTEACWYVIAKKTMRVEVQRMILLSKELDQIAVDLYGRYEGWEPDGF